jgi:hypothetical protein
LPLGKGLRPLRAGRFAQKIPRASGTKLLLADVRGRFEDHDLSERIGSFPETSLTAENKHLRLTLLVRCRRLACDRMKVGKLRRQVDRMTANKTTYALGRNYSFVRHGDLIYERPEEGLKTEAYTRGDVLSRRSCSLPGSPQEGRLRKAHC